MQLTLIISRLLALISPDPERRALAGDQLAGDLIPSATPGQLVATGFNRNHPLNGEGGRIAEENRVEYVLDRTDTTATVWMALTLGCAKCHDHKFDPLSQKEYYRFSAYFNSIAESGRVDKGGNANPVARVTTRAQQTELASQMSFPRKPSQPFPPPAAPRRPRVLSGSRWSD